MDIYDVEAMLENKPKGLFLFSRNIKRAHQLEERVCKECGVVWTLVRKRCKDKTCTYCAPLRARYQRLCRQFQRLSIVPSHLIHFVLPYRSIPLQKLCQEDVTKLHKALAKILRQAWFKRVVKGGFYFIELDINERWEARLHIHMLIEAYQTAASKPINISKASAAWKKLTGQSIQRPKPLRKNTIGEANKLFEYIVKQMCGETGITILRELQRYIDVQTDKLQMYEGRKRTHWHSIETRKKYIRRAERLRVHIIDMFNSIFSGNQRRAFFGSWRGRKPIKLDHSTRKPNYLCSCGFAAYPEPIPPIASSA